MHVTRKKNGHHPQFPSLSYFVSSQWCQHEYTSKNHLLRLETIITHWKCLRCKWVYGQVSKHFETTYHDTESSWERVEIKKNTSGAINCCMTLTTTSRYAHRNRGINTGEMVTFDSSPPTKRTPSDHVGEWNQHMALNWSANDLTRMQFEDTVENHGGSMIFHVRGGRGVVDSITPSLHRKNFDGYTNRLWQTKKVTWKGKRPGTKPC